jgi:menaquinone-dependent protoporphyrinogen oxidase
MNVLIAVASKHGSTAGIGEAIADELKSMGIDADPRNLTHETDFGRYGAAVIGSAVYMGRWLTEAFDFVYDHEIALHAVPVWLFSSGPLGTDQSAPSGDPAALDEIMEATGARGHRLFSGRLDKDQLGLGERLIARVVHAPAGDFRDWDAIREWAREIGEELRTKDAESGDETTTRPAA